MKLLFLGTGTSHGVPVIGCDCPVCKSSDPHDKRFRCSAYVTTASGKNILIDIGPDFRSQALACIKRLHGMNDESLVVMIATQPSDTAKQVCLYAMMKYNRLVWDFMVTVIGEKYRNRDMSFGRRDLNVYFIRLQEQIDSVAAWSDTTVAKAKQVLLRVLVENEYLDATEADHLNPVWLDSQLENAIRANHDEAMLPAFNCLE